MIHVVVKEEDLVQSCGGDSVSGSYGHPGFVVMWFLITILGVWWHHLFFKCFWLAGSDFSISAPYFSKPHLIIWVVLILSASPWWQIYCFLLINNDQWNIKTYDSIWWHLQYSEITACALSVHNPFSTLYIHLFPILVRQLFAFLTAWQTIMIQEAWRPNKFRCKLNSRPRYRAFGEHHWDTPKSTPNEHVKQELCKTSGKLLRKWLETLIMIYFRAQNNLEIGPLRPIFNTLLEVA